MSTPATAYPFSPSPASSTYSNDAAGSPLPTEERRRSKRESTASATRRREEDAARYPSPPPASNRSRPTSIDASLVIPPFNPNNRRTSGSTTPQTGSISSRQSGLDERMAGLLPVNPAQHHQQGVGRPMSAFINPVASPAPVQDPQAGTSKVRQSVGHFPVQASRSSAGPYPQLYTPHPMPRQKIYFGPYILLQTLGEGEFGKVKLGVHSERWGEDVAIKLIKRGNVDTAQRGEKVRREIEVLKAVRHPNIVRLYDVIETEKYIGIVLEYASGGELFDHILAHRYLKERDASRLFAQLVSGVAYLHAKGVVHRDLKLENLLLDRNRNCIITDFGFANRFRNAEIDLMATSCGSPCYAAPELVVQEGKYIGTSVDVWSCGVILYAMLAGYLPYDDDPNNPEGDNINLLYKYILNTPLAFPDWIGEEPRDLLLRMLVPDPAQRCTIHDVMRHSWLRKYASAFDKSVEQLEMQAQEAELFKRQALEAQRQFLIQQQMLARQQNAAGQTQGMTRSQSTLGQMSGPPSASTRHRSAMVTSASTTQAMDMQQLPAAVPEGEVAPTARPISIQSIGEHPHRRSGAFVPTSPTTGTSRIHADADPFSFEPRAPSPAAQPMSVAMKASLSAPPDPPAVKSESPMFDMTSMSPPASSTRSRRSSVNPSPAPSATRRESSGSTQEDAERERRKKAHRATVQVEYDGSASARRKPVAGLEISAPLSEPIVSRTEDVVMSPIETETSTLESMQSVQDELSALSNQPASVTTALPEALPVRSATPPLIPIPFPATPPTATSSAALSSGSSTSTPKKRKSSGSPSNTQARADTSSDIVPTSVPDVQATPRAKKTSATPSAVSAQSGRPPSVASSRKNAASNDRFSIRSLLSGSQSSLDRPAKIGESDLDDTSTRRKSRRQKALSLQPFRHTMSSKVSKKSEVLPAVASSKSAPRSRSSTITAKGSEQTSTSMPPPPKPTTQRPVTRASVQAPPPAVRQNSTDLEANWSGSQASGGKAKAVMDWFRRRSTRNYPGGGSSDSGSGSAAPTPIAIDFDRRQPALVATSEAPASSNVSMRDDVATPVLERTPSVVVTGTAFEAMSALPSTSEEESQPSSRSASGAHSQLSQVSQKSASTVATSVSAMSTTIPAALFTRPTTIAPPPVPPPFPQNRLRVHQGALDKNAVTSKPPPDVMSQVKQVLWNMGIDAVQEGDFKFKCVRKSRKKAFPYQSSSVNSAASNSSHGHSTSGSVERRSGVPSSASVSSNLATGASGSFRSLFARKNSGPSLLPSPSLGGKGSVSLAATSATTSPAMAMYSTEESFEQSPITPSVTQFGQFSSIPGSPQPLPTYGEGNTDHGDEVRFYIELTRVKHLEGLYCVDVKRMRGAAFSFQTVYNQLVGGLDLGPV